MEITFLGTSSMVPTRQRNQSACLIRHGQENILVDCGEGTQRQFTLAGISLPKITKILITHWHGDHVLGLPGLIQTLNTSDYMKTLEIYGPKGTKKFMKHMVAAFAFVQKIKIKIIEVSSGTFLETAGLRLSAAPLKHTTLCVGYRIEERVKRKIIEAKMSKHGVPKGPLWGKAQSGKDITYKGKRIRAKDVTKEDAGKSVAIFGDTTLCQGAIKLAKEVSVLICESTYEKKYESKAKGYCHLTSMQAAGIARDAKAKKLYITHFSARYKEVKQIVKEAKTVFKNTVAAKDFLKVKI